MSPKYQHKRYRVLQFTFSGTMEIGRRQVEVSPREYRVHFDEYMDGSVCILQLDRQSGKDWIKDGLLDEMDQALRDALEQDIKAEQEEITASYDRWRYGS